MVQKRFHMAILVVLLGLLAKTNQSNAECCDNKISLVPNCQIIHGCWAYICPDGTPLSGNDNFCGVGSCNIFGCDCDGGCRKNIKGYDRAEALKQYRLKTQKPRKTLS